MEEDYSPYCNKCQACGEEGCCSALVCNHSKDGEYCRGYLDDLRFGYIMFRETYKLLEENHNDELEKIYNKNYNLIYNKMESENKNIAVISYNRTDFRLFSEDFDLNKSTLPTVKKFTTIDGDEYYSIISPSDLIGKSFDKVIKIKEYYRNPQHDEIMKQINKHMK